MTATTLPIRLLAAGVPLTLLIDLLAPEGPDSHAIAQLERVTAAVVAPREGL